MKYLNCCFSFLPDHADVDVNVIVEVDVVLEVCLDLIIDDDNGYEK